MDTPKKKRDMEDQPADMTDDEGMAGGQSEVEDVTEESTVEDLDQD